MSKTQQDYLGQNSSIEDGFIKLKITDLVSMAKVNNDITFDSTDTNGITALIIAALFYGASPDVDEDGYTITDNTQAIVSDTRSSRKSLITRDGEKQVLQKYIFEVYLQDNTDFNPSRVIGSTSFSGSPSF